MNSNPALEAWLRRAFRYLNKYMVLLWRLGMGGMLNSWPSFMGRYLVLTTIGRKSGLPRRTPVNYAQVNGELYCTAGFGAVSDWYRNIRTNPHVEVWLPEGRWDALAIDVSTDANRLTLLREVLIGSGFVAPMIGIDPRTISDDALSAVSSEYRLIKLQRVARREGPDGPGDLLWVWPLLGIAGAAFLGIRSRLRKR